MLNEYVQQWSAIQTVRAASLDTKDVFMVYFGLTGDADEFDVQGYLSGLVMLPAPDRDLLAHAVHELLDSTGSMVDGAHHSNQGAASSSGYDDYLRDVALSPDGYDFPHRRRAGHQVRRRTHRPGPSTGLALCATTIEQDRTLVITNSALDPEWRDHPLVTDGPGIRFYAGHPISTVDGWRIGTLCLIDDQPRTFSEEDEQALRCLAAQLQLHIWV
ncbi:GAF domain-containing protein [Arthrobacter sp. MDT2-2]